MIYSVEYNYTKDRIMDIQFLVYFYIWGDLSGAKKRAIR